VYLWIIRTHLHVIFESGDALLTNLSLFCSCNFVIVIKSCRQLMADTSVSPGPYAIFVTTPDRNNEGTTLLRITANGLASDGCSGDVCNWLMRSLAFGTYFSLYNLESCFRWAKRDSSHIFPRCFFINQIIIWQYRLWDSNRILISSINCTTLHINMP
jgi:hypothetical protein